MNYRKLTAIIRSNVLEKVEHKLQGMGVHGISKVEGYGEFAYLYSNDWLVTHARLEILTDESRAEAIARTIMETAHVGLEGDGVVAVLPVERICRIRTGTEVTDDEI